MLQHINTNTYVSGVLSEFLFRISDIDVKYSFNSIAIFSDFVMFLSSTINSPGSVFDDGFFVINGSQMLPNEFRTCRIINGV